MAICVINKVSKYTKHTKHYILRTRCIIYTLSSHLFFVSLISYFCKDVLLLEFLHVCKCDYVHQLVGWSLIWIVCWLDSQSPGSIKVRSNQVQENTMHSEYHA